MQSRIVSNISEISTERNQIMHSHISLKSVIMHFLRRIQKEKKQVFIKQQATLTQGMITDAFNTIDGEHDPTLINTNVEWMQENMNRVDYEPRKSRKSTKKKTTNLEKFTE